MGQKQVKIRVVPNAAKNEVIKASDGSLKVRVTARAVEGKANKAVIEVLADYFGVRKNKVQIVRGEKGREKVISISK